MSVEAQFWRAVAVFRTASLVYAALLIAQNHRDYAHPVGGWIVLAVMAAWTAVATYGRRRPRPSPPGLGTRVFLIADLVVSVGCLVATRWVETPSRIEAGVRTLPIIWVASAVLSWAVSGGKRGGAAAAAVIALGELAIHAEIGDAAESALRLQLSPGSFNSVVLLFFLGLIVGHVAELAVEAQRQTARALELEAAQRERERLARSIHDSVLQVLALVQRRGAEVGGEAAELGRLAGEQEAALRALIGTGGGASHGRQVPETVDLRDLLMPFSSASVTVSAPATPVTMPVHDAGELAAAVGAAVDNVRRHCGERAPAWILVEDEGALLTVSVRDDGPGIPEGRLEQAESDGRLGIAQSIRGRIRDLGGSVLITSAEGAGTEIELRLPLG